MSQISTNWLSRPLRQRYTNSLLLLSLLLPPAIAITPAIAEQVSSNNQTFIQAPRLVRSATSFYGTSAPAVYQFTVTVPENAGAPLQAISIDQRENLETVRFDVGASQAFEGDSFAGGPKVTLANVGGADPEPGEATVVFDPPIEPGKTVTVSLRARRNPELGGIYLFGITAYPAGDTTDGQFIGYGRLHFNNY